MWFIAIKCFAWGQVDIRWLRGRKHDFSYSLFSVLPSSSASFKLFLFVKAILLPPNEKNSLNVTFSIFLQCMIHQKMEIYHTTTTKSLQLCPILWDPRDGSPPGSAIPGILQARTLEWVAISFSNAWKWSRSVVSDSQRPYGLQPTRLLRPWDFPGKNTGVGCHCLLRIYHKSQQI